MTEVIRSITTSKEVHVEGSLKECQKHGIASIGKLLREINNSLKPPKKQGIQNQNKGNKTLLLFIELIYFDRSACMTNNQKRINKKTTKEKKRKKNKLQNVQD